VQNEGADPDASVAARIGQAASAGSKLEVSSRAAVRWTRSGETVGSAPNRPISNRHLAIRNGCKMLKIKDGCTV
jgi:hypothetical protein